MGEGDAAPSHEPAPRATAQLSVVAEKAGLSAARVYELFRLPGAPPPVFFKACMPLYDLDRAVAYVRGGRDNRSDRAG